MEYSDINKKQIIESVSKSRDEFIKPNQSIISTCVTLALLLLNHGLIRLKRFVSQSSHNLCNWLFL
jgi:hypothetical protein